MYDRELLVSTLAGFTRTLLQPYDVETVLQDLAERVTAVLRLAGSGVMLVDHERLTYATSVPDRVAALEEIQEEKQSGPCVQAYRSHEIVAVSDLSVRTQDWGAYCAAAAAAGIRAGAGIPMSLDDTVVGVLNLHASVVREWSDDDLAIAQALADMATGYLINASQLGQQFQLNEQLQRALDSRVIIEQAKGILAATHDIPIEAAFDLIRAHARSHNAPLRSVADAIVHVGLKL